MNELQAILEGLEDRELDYVLERSKVSKDSQALRAMGISTGTFYSWTAERRQELAELAQKLKRASAVRAIMKLQNATESAADVKIGGLKSRNEHVKQAAATEILDRQLGKPTQKQEITSETDGTITINVIHDKKD